MLDFKIKELKRQIEPRETEIGNMKEQIKEMDKDLEQVTKLAYIFSVPSGTFGLRCWGVSLGL